MTLTAPLAGAASTAPVQGQPVISAVSGNQAGMWAPASEAQLEMSQMQAAGVQMVRFDAPWQCVEPKAPVNGVHTYDWSDTGSCQLRAPDTAVAMLAEHHLTWLPVIDYSAIWDSQLQTVFSPPVNDSYYAEYAAALAARYGTDGSFWKQNPQLPYEPVTVFEIWNEETGYPTWDVGLKTWSASTIQTEAGRYATLYQDASEAIHAVDPNGKVIVGGMGGGSYVNWYVSDMFKADPWLEGHVDGFGLHPYAADAAEVEHNVALLRTQLDLLGESSAPIYITEVGWPTGNASVEAQRAAWMSQLAAAFTHSECGIALVSPYAWYDPTENFSLATDSGLLPAGTAWFDGLNSSAAPSGQPLCSAYPASTAAASGSSSSGASSSGTSSPNSATSSSASTRPVRTELGAGTRARSRRQQHRGARPRDHRRARPRDHRRARTRARRRHRHGQRHRQRSRA